MDAVTWRRALGWRMARQHLVRRAPVGDAVRVAGVLGGLHAQVMPAAELGTWLAALGTYRKYGNVGHPEVDALSEAVGRALAGRVLSRDELADAVVGAGGGAAGGGAAVPGGARADHGGAAGAVVAGTAAGRAAGERAVMLAAAGGGRGGPAGDLPRSRSGHDAIHITWVITLGLWPFDMTLCY